MDASKVRRPLLFAGLVAALGCGGPDGSSSFTSCDQETACGPEVCTRVQECLVDECEWEVTYEFAGEEYESTCTFGPRTITTVYPVDGGPGTKRIERDFDQCYYYAEVQFNDYEEEGRCTPDPSCTFQELQCGPSDDGNPDCSVIDESPCVIGATSASSERP